MFIRESVGHVSYHAFVLHDYICVCLERICASHLEDCLLETSGYFSIFLFLNIKLFLHKKPLVCGLGSCGTNRGFLYFALVLVSLLFLLSVSSSHLPDVWFWCLCCCMNKWMNSPHKQTCMKTWDWFISRTKLPEASDLQNVKEWSRNLNQQHYK